ALSMAQNRAEQHALQPTPTAQITSQMAGNIRALFPE
ncbi:chromosome partitioning protein, partial [Escherichia coli]